MHFGPFADAPRASKLSPRARSSHRRDPIILHHTEPLSLDRHLVHAELNPTSFSYSALFAEIDPSTHP
jgi:hypothetical protein